jgi:ureidoglycolate hydrolase
MDITSQHTVAAQVLTDGAFAPFGDIIKPRRSGEQGERKYAYKPAEEENHVTLVLTNGEPCLRIMHQFARGSGSASSPVTNGSHSASGRCTERSGS